MMKGERRRGDWGNGRGSDRLGEWKQLERWTLKTGGNTGHAAAKKEARDLTARHSLEA